MSVCICFFAISLRHQLSVISGETSLKLILRTSLSRRSCFDATRRKYLIDRLIVSSKKHPIPFVPPFHRPLSFRLFPAEISIPYLFLVFYKSMFQEILALIISMDFSTHAWELNPSKRHCVVRSFH